MPDVDPGTAGRGWYQEARCKPAAEIFPVQSYDNPCQRETLAWCNSTKAMVRTPRTRNSWEDSSERNGMEPVTSEYNRLPNNVLNQCAKLYSSGFWQ
ncbi:MAG: hypothetical protein ACLULH_13255 [Bacteroides fragilis]